LVVFGGRGDVLNRDRAPGAGNADTTYETAGTRAVHRGSLRRRLTCSRARSRLPPGRDRGGWCPRSAEVGSLIRWATRPSSVWRRGSRGSPGPPADL